MKTLLMRLLAVAASVAGPCILATTTVPTTTYNPGPTVTVTDGTTIQTGSGATVVVSSGAAVLYEAGTSITLNPGFTASSGSYFDASITSDIAPSTPSDLLYWSESSSFVSLNWYPTSATLPGTYYQIYRDGATTPVGTSYLPTFTDTSVAANTNYTYTVVEYNAYGSSPTSASLSVQTLPSTGSAVSPETLLGLSTSTTTDTGNTMGFILQNP